MMKSSIENLPKDIYTPSILMRLLCLGDEDAFYKMTNVPEIANIISFLSYPVDRAFPKQWIEKNNSSAERVYGIFSDNVIIGNIGIHMNDQNELEIGYWVNPAFTGKGIASLAVKELINSVRSVYPQYSIFAECLPDNGGSLRVLEKTGFVVSNKPGKRENRIRLEYRNL